VDRFWETGPEEICPICLEYGHTTYKGCSEPPRCYICAGPHEATKHKCPITGCLTLKGKACIHLPIKCVRCNGPHLAISLSCPKRRAAIEEAKARKQAAKDLEASRRRIQVVIPVRKTQEAPRSTEMELDNTNSEVSKQIKA